MNGPMTKPLPMRQLYWFRRLAYTLLVLSIMSVGANAQDLVKPVAPTLNVKARPAKAPIHAVTTLPAKATTIKGSGSSSSSVAKGTTSVAKGTTPEKAKAVTATPTDRVGAANARTAKGLAPAVATKRAPATTKSGQVPSRAALLARQHPATEPEYSPEVAKRIYDLELQMKKNPERADQLRPQLEQLLKQKNTGSASKKSKK